jgi:hypothetical protein
VGRGRGSDPRLHDPELLAHLHDRGHQERHADGDERDVRHAVVDEERLHRDRRDRRQLHGDSRRGHDRGFFTDTSTGNPTSWQWDFENDGIVDATSRNTAFVYPAPGQYTCRLTVADAFSNDTTTQTLDVAIIPVPVFGSTSGITASTRGFWFQSPTRFSIISAKVPDEGANGIQNVALFRLAAAPPS